MRRADEARRCMLMVSVLGLSQAIATVTTMGVAIFLRAITSKNLSPLWAGKRLLEGCPDGVVVRIDWHFPDDEADVGARLCKVGGELRLEGGGLGYDLDEAHNPEIADGEPAGAVAGTVVIQVAYGPRHLLRWIAEACEGPETVGETEPTKPVPGGPSNGPGHDGEFEFGGSFQTKVNPWR